MRKQLKQFNGERMRFTTTVERYILREAALTPFDVSMAPEILM